MSEVDRILSTARTKLSNAINALGGKNTNEADRIIKNYDDTLAGLGTNHTNTINIYNNAVNDRRNAQNNLGIGRYVACVRSSRKWYLFGANTCDEYQWRNTPAREQALTSAIHNENTALIHKNNAGNAYNSYLNDKTAYNNAKQLRATIIQQQNDVNNATSELNTAYKNAKTVENNAYNAESIFMTNANIFQTNTGTSSATYSAMVAKWDAYKIARTSFPSAPNSSNYDSFFIAYNNFITSKAAYIASLTSNVLIGILNTNTSSIFSDITKNNATLYGLTTQYADLLQSLTTVRSNTNNVAIFLENYAAYLTKKNNYDRLLANAIAKANAKKVWEEAKSILDSKNSALKTAQNELTTAQGAKSSAETAQANATKAVEGATSAKANYDAAVLEKNNANDLLTKATTILTTVNNNIKASLEGTFNADQTFMTNAGAFPNQAIGTNTEYNNMSAKWTNYTSKKTELNAIELTKIKEIADALIALRNAYTIFTEAKLAYGRAVLAKLNSTDENTYITTNSTIIDDLKLNTAQYNVLKQSYDAIKNEWNNVTRSVNTSKVDDAINNYNTYITKKGNFETALLLGQNQRDEAIFQGKLIGGRNVAAKWVTSAAPGCRNVQTVATTDQSMLENIACNDNEYLSGYTTVRGFDAAPAETNMTKDNTNIAQYLAVKYSCCTAPSSTKGAVGLTGLPGVSGTPGKVGPKGPDGSVGPKGPIGEIGDKGPDGPKGDKGEIGDVGEIGPIGSMGGPGTSITVPATKQIVGPPGPKGKAGPMGKQGLKGAPGKVEIPPPRPPTQLDRTVALLNIQDKLKNYLHGKYNK